ncbi:MAG: ABC transporter permease subunit [Acutalibacteraceae bacterium]
MRYATGVLAALILMGGLLTGCGMKDDGAIASSTSAPVAEYSTFADLSGKTVSMLTGAPFEDLVRGKAPDVGEFTFFNNTPDMILALKAGKTDAFLSNNAVTELAVNRNPELALFPQDLQTGTFGFAFAKGDPRRDAWQKACDAIPDETRRALWAKWTGSDDSAKTLPKQDWPGKNGTVQAAVCDTLEPMSYMGDGGQIVGFDIEMILLIARELDVHVAFTGMEFSAVMSSVQAGKAMIGAGSIIATDERKQSVDFVEYYPARFTLAVRSVPAGPAKTLAAMQNASIGVLTGTNFPQIVEAALPQAELLYFNTIADEVNALKSGKVDAVALDGPVARNIKAQDGSLDVLFETLDAMEYAFALGKSESGEALCADLNDFLRALKADGTMELLQKKWFDSGDLAAVSMADYRTLPAANGTVRLATFQYPPFVLQNEEMLVGYEIELMTLFCQERGYALEIFDMSTDAVLAAVQSGKCDVACCCISITEERKESVLFSEPDYTGGTALLVEKGVKSQSGGFFAGLRDSFEKTFLRENRWKLFAEGIGTTLLITVLSILLGTVLGFLTFMACRNGNPVANAITRFCVWLVQGMPVVVLLMVLYYIVFGSVAIPGAAVSVVGFTLIFGAAVFNMLKAGVGTIDRGQTEAAYALGYTDRQTFFRVVLPQAMPHFMPAYKGEITALIKATAVVGYVAVQDLTKMGDVIRSRTYEAFFPLIAVAVIYFVLAAILTFIVNKIEIRIDPRRRSRADILKGVDGR